MHPLLKFLLHAVLEEFGIGIAEAIDALLFVAYYQVVVAVTRTFLEQRRYVLILHHRGILKFIYQIMVNPGAHALIHKEHITLAHHVFKQLIGVAQQHGFVAAQKFFHLQAYYAQKSEIKEIILHILQHLYFRFYGVGFLHHSAHIVYQAIVLACRNFPFPRLIGAPRLEVIGGPRLRFLKKFFL